MEGGYRVPDRQKNRSFREKGTRMDGWRCEILIKRGEYGRENHTQK